MPRFFLTSAAISGFLAVCFGAFGAHALKIQLSAPLLSAYHTAVEYQFYHTFALLAVALLILNFGRCKWLLLAGYCFTAGIILFSGSLYAMALGGPKWLGLITPLGGLAFIVAWASMAFAAATHNR